MRNHSNRLFKRLMMALAGIIIAFGLTGCTKSFCTNQDKSNQLFAYYGDLYQEEILIDVKKISEDPNFRDLLGYINTKSDEQRKNRL